MLRLEALFEEPWKIPVSNLQSWREPSSQQLMACMQSSLMQHTVRAPNLLLLLAHPRIGQ